MYSPISTATAAFLLGFIVLGQAYIIDDTNSTVQYYGKSTHFGGGTWIHDATEDKTLFFNGTDSECFCLGSEDCGLKIPFTGSGITVYSRLMEGVNASFAVDGGLPHLYSHDGSCAFNTHPGCPNVSIYNIQSLAFDDHVLEITVLSFDDSTTDFDFDYAVVNDTTTSVVTMTRSSSAPSSTRTSTPPSHLSQKRIAVALGGALGGLAAISVVVLILFCFRKRSHSNVPHNDIDAQPQDNSTLAFRIDPLFLPQLVISSGNSPTIPPVAGIDTHEVTGALPPSIPPNNLRNKTSSTHISIISTPPTTQDPAPINDAVVTEAATHTHSSSVGHGLTALQVDSLHSLLRQNIPGPVVATVMESMLSGEASPTNDNGLRIVVDADTDETSPPAYERGLDCS